MCCTGSAKLFAAAHRLIGVAILQQLDHDIVELDEADVEPLCAAPQVGNADRSRIDPACVRLDFLVGQQRVLHAIALEVAVAENLGAAQHGGIEFIGAFHVLDGETEMLDALQPRAERRLVALRRRHAVGALCSSRRSCRHAASRQAREHGDAGGLKRSPAADLGSVVVMVGHFLSP